MRNVIKWVWAIALAVTQCWATVDFEQEFVRGKTYQSKALTLLTGIPTKPEDIERNLENINYWKGIRDKFVELLTSHRTEGSNKEFEEITKSLSNSNKCLRKSSIQNDRFPYPHLYLALNYCIGAIHDDARQSYLELKRLESEENVSEAKLKHPLLLKLIAAHDEFACQRTELTAKDDNALGFRFKMSATLSLLAAFYGREYVMEFISTLGYYSLERGWNHAFLACFESRHALPYITYAESLVAFTLVSLLSLTFIYIFFPTESFGFQYNHKPTK